MTVETGRDTIGSSQQISRYYKDLTAFYYLYGRTHGFHYGIWEPDIKTHGEALLRSSEVLVRDLPITPQSTILDAGCGIGSFAIWCAKQFGCRVTGINVCEEQVQLARRFAERAGVSQRCTFHVMDMMSITLPPRSFHYVFNQETLCYATDTEDYLRGIYRLLEPGGWWTALAFSRRSEPFSMSEAAQYQKVREGFHIPCIASGPEVRTLLEDVGFEDLEVADLTHRVYPSSRTIIRLAAIPLAMMRLRIDWLLFGREAELRRNRQGHHVAGYLYSRGLLSGTFRYFLYRGRRPIQSRGT